MKKTILMTAMLSTLLLSCKDNKTTSAETHQHDTENVMPHEHESIDELLSNTWLNEMQMDDGKKWEANIETTVGVTKMLEILNDFNPQTLEEYHTMAQALNEQKNYIIQECTMTGPSHDNLHTFLHPLIDKIDALLKVESIDKAKAITKSINDNAKEYFNFFK